MLESMQLDWFLEAMVAAQEVPQDSVAELRGLQRALDEEVLVPQPGAAAAAAAPAGDGAAHDEDEEAPSAELVSAIQWWESQRR